MHTGQVLAGDAGLHVGVGAHAEEHGVVLLEQLLEVEVAADLGVEAELDAHVLEDGAASPHDGLLEFELGNAEGQQAADLRLAVKDHGLDAVACQHIGAGETRRTGADDGHAPAAVGDVRQVRPPALLERGVGDVLLDGADGHRAETVVESTGALAQAILRAHAAADLRQGVGAVRQLGGLFDVALGHQRQPVGDIVVHRAFPRAIGIAAVETAIGLLRRGITGEAAVDLAVLTDALCHRFLVRVVALHLDELKIVSHIKHSC